ncbi:hypothetical protein ACOME3_010124 [Neoechinorhynchus agilis]
MLKPAHIFPSNIKSIPRTICGSPGLYPIHLIVCVHGLDGSSSDLRLFQTFIKQTTDRHMAAAGSSSDISDNLSFDFLMASSNQDCTFDGFEVMVTNLYDEIRNRIDQYQSYRSDEDDVSCDSDKPSNRLFALDKVPARISFIGHSLGNLVIRALVADQRFEPLRSQLYTFLSVCGPHLGTMFATNAIVNFGMWLMQKWKKSTSLAQLALRDHSDFKRTFLFKLSKKPCFEYFKNILLLASPQDHYVPIHSARIEPCKQAFKDSQCGSLYVEMVSNILTPVLKAPSINMVRYTTFMNFAPSPPNIADNVQSAPFRIRRPDGSLISIDRTTGNASNNPVVPPGFSSNDVSTSSAANAANNLIGRSAHVAALDSEAFVEKLIVVSVGKYFL